MALADGHHDTTDPRAVRSRDAILRAAWSIVAERGYSSATIEAIAERAGVGKPTIYRRWPNRAAVVMDAFLVESEAVLPLPDLGSAREDFRERLRAVVQALTSHPRGAALAGLIGDAQQDAPLAAAIADRFIAPLRVGVIELLERGIARGDLREDLDKHVALDALFGPIYYRLLVSRAPLDERFTDALVDHVFPGLSRRNGQAPSP
jgi:AcrR family transcriptional regulator